MDVLQMTAPCGLPCFNCVIHLSKDNPALRERMAKQFGVPAEKVECPGRREVKGKCPVMSEACQVYPCTTRKAIKFCYECLEFPCDHLHPYADQAGSMVHNTKVYQLCLIKKMGLAAWAKEKAKSVRDAYFKEKMKM